MFYLFILEDSSTWNYHFFSCAECVPRGTVCFNLFLIVPCGTLIMMI